MGGSFVVGMSFVVEMDFAAGKDIPRAPAIIAKQPTTMVAGCVRY